ncbi:MAG TPA: molecular chaperone TorD family protein [Ramlibacter sp.]|jgi:TorA maturation chaperone TorD|uniref:TorD/DmsD family molecular chaperone n=1 Tax=Ramlibacter sp. TaxID=1917967 RepID=UPI002D404344|nr:molecular chaperone TorD family protein [Ramlibacter sp.]HZY18273.1 molecular chaperone TorD family protein [Ramlibacter sp.]
MQPCPELVDPDPDDQARAGVYSLLARLLLDADERAADWLAAQAPLSGGSDSAVEAAWSRLVVAARSQRAGLARAHAAMFVALGTPDINPYASYYVDGSLMNVSLAQVRRDLVALGLHRAERSRELEDHLGALCDAMAQLIVGGAPPAAQARFLERHIAGWSFRCLREIAAHPSAGLYGPLADFAAAFLASEQDAFVQEPVPE